MLNEFSVMGFTVFQEAVCDIVDSQHVLVILFLHVAVDCPGYHLHPPLGPVPDIIPATAPATQTFEWRQKTLLCCQSFTSQTVEGEKLTARQSPSVWGRPRSRRASTGCDGEPNPTRRPSRSSRGVSTARKSEGCRFQADSGSTACESAPWPQPRHSVSSGAMVAITTQNKSCI